MRVIKIGKVPFKEKRFMLTEKDYCDKDLSDTLKDLGFPTKITFIGEQATIEIPINSGQISLYEAQKWLREEKGMLLQPTYLELSDEWICVIRDKNKRHGYSAQKQKDYEEALSEGVRASIKILQDEQKENN